MDDKKVEKLLDDLKTKLSHAFITGNIILSTREASDVIFALGMLNGLLNGKDHHKEL